MNKPNPGAEMLHLLDAGLLLKRSDG